MTSGSTRRAPASPARRLQGGLEHLVRGYAPGDILDRQAGGHPPHPAGEPHQKNSSSLLAKMARNLTRSSSGTFPSWASSSTRWLNPASRPRARCTGPWVGHHPAAPLNLRPTSAAWSPSVSGKSIARRHSSLTEVPASRLRPQRFQCRIQTYCPFQYRVTKPKRGITVRRTKQLRQAGWASPAHGRPPAARKRPPKSQPAERIAPRWPRGRRRRPAPPAAQRGGQRGLGAFHPEPVLAANRADAPGRQHLGRTETAAGVPRLHARGRPAGTGPWPPASDARSLAFTPVGLRLKAIRATKIWGSGAPRGLRRGPGASARVVVRSST